MPIECIAYPSEIIIPYNSNRLKDIKGNRLRLVDNSTYSLINAILITVVSEDTLRNKSLRLMRALRRWEMGELGPFPSPV